MQATNGAHAATAHTRGELLWAGKGHTAIDMLSARGLRVVQCTAEQCVAEAVARAPDLIVLSGDAASQMVSTIEAALRTQGALCTPPVVVLAKGLARSSAERRFGVVERLSAESTGAAVCEAIEARLRGLEHAEAVREVTLKLGELDAFVNKTVREGGSGVLTCQDPALTVAFGPFGTLRTPASLPVAAQRESRTLRLLELSASRLRVLCQPLKRKGAVALGGAQVVVLHADPARAEQVCVALGEAGAEAHALGLEASEIASLPALSPTLIVLSRDALAVGPVQALWEDARLASVAWLVVDDAKLQGRAAHDVAAFASELLAPKLALQRRLQEDALVLERIESFSPAGWLKEMGRISFPRTLVLHAAQGRGELTFADTKIREASFVAAGESEVQTGRAALQAVLAMRHGRVMVGTPEAIAAFEASLRTPAPRLVSVPPPPDPEDDDATIIRERVPLDLLGLSQPKLDAAGPSQSKPEAPEPSQSKADAPEPSPTQSDARGPSQSKPEARGASQSKPDTFTPSKPKPDALGLSQPKPAAFALARPKPEALAVSQPEPSERPERPRLPLPPRRSQEPESSAASAPKPSAPTPREPERSVGPEASKPAAAPQKPDAPTAAAPPPLPASKAATQAKAAQPEAPASSASVADAPLSPPDPFAPAQGVQDKAPPAPSANAQVPLDPFAPAQAFQEKAPLAPSANTQSSPLDPFAPVQGVQDKAPPAPSAKAQSSRLDPFAPAQAAQATPAASAFAAAQPTNVNPPARDHKAPAKVAQKRASGLWIAAGVGVAVLGGAYMLFARSDTLAPQPAYAGVEEKSAPSAPSEPAPGAAANTPAPQGAQAAAADAHKAAQPSAVQASPAPARASSGPVPRGSEDAARLDRAKRASEAGRHAEAEALLNEVLAAYPDDYQAHFYMGLTMVRRRRFDEAHEHVARALELNRTPQVWLLEGDIFLQEGKRVEALNAWKKCLEVRADFEVCKERLARWKMR